MSVLYLDCFSGISGDMCLGALLDVGGDAAALQEELGKLGLGGAFHLNIRKILKNGVSCTDVDVTLEEDADSHGHTHEHDHAHTHEHDHEHDHAHTHEHDHAQPHGQEHGHAHVHVHGAAGHVHRGLSDILGLIQGSGLSQQVKDTARAIFTTLANAEAKMHGTTVEEVHFHEVGAIDAIVDIVGSAILYHQLKPEKVFCSRINVGSGYVQCAHGLFPVPAPAVSEILRGKPFFMGPGRGELCTPTGAAIAVTLADEFAKMPPLVVEKVGYGAGKKEMETLNALRVFMGVEGKKA